MMERTLWWRELKREEVWEVGESSERGDHLKRVGMVAVVDGRGVNVERSSGVEVKNDGLVNRVSVYIRSGLVHAIFPRGKG